MYRCHPSLSLSVRRPYKRKFYFPGPIVFGLSLLLQSLVWLSCGHGGHRHLYYLPAGDGSRLFADFAGIDLLGENPGPTAEDFSLPPTPGEREAWPAVRWEEGQLCIQSQQDFFFYNEAGLRIAYCEKGKEGEADTLVQTMEEIRSNGTVTAFPDIRRGRIELSVRTPSQLRDIASPIAAVVDGGHGTKSPLEQASVKGGQLHFQYRLPMEEGSWDRIPAPLPRRFPLADFFLLVSDGGFYLAYPLPDHGGRLLVLHIQDDAAAGMLRKGLGRIPRMEADLYRMGAYDRPFVSEIFFGNQGNSGREFIEIASGQSDSLVDYSLTTDTGAPFTGKQFLFGESTLLLERSEEDSFRMNGLATLTTRLPGQANVTTELPYDTLKSEGASDLRTLSRDAHPGEEALHATLRCMHDIPCSSRGIHPRLASMTAESDSLAPSGGYISSYISGAESSYCGKNDYALSEINPFGVQVPGESAIQTGGKFLELRRLRECRNGLVLFEAGGSLLDPGFESAPSQDPLLFAADRSYFSFAQLREYSSLRSLQAFSPVQAVDLTDGSSLSLRTVPPEGLTFIRGAGDIAGDPGLSPLAAVYSLVPATNAAMVPDSASTGEAAGGGDVGGSRGELFHGRYGEGLRPDLLGVNAMSPGTIYARGTPSAPFRPALSISEILPEGSRTPAGVSVADDEFFELVREVDSFPKELPGMVRLSVKRKSNGSLSTYLLPPPGQGPMAVMRNTPVCFSTSSQIVRFPDLSLPNEAATYTLSTGTTLSADPLPLDSATIDRATFGAMDSPSLRTSIAHHFRAGIWRTTDGITSPGEICAPATRATPGATESFAPFFLERGRTGQSLDLTFYTDTPASSLLWRWGRDLTTPLGETPVFPADGEDLRLTLPSGGLPPRIVMEIYRSDAPGGRYFQSEFFPATPLLRVDAVSPTPVTGEVEWVRLCSPAGFLESDAASALVIRDSSSEDRIVPYLARFAHPPAGFLLDGSSLTLAADRCAILVDPDYAGTPLPLEPEDTRLWTIESSQTLGNGLSSGEAFLILRREPDTTVTPLCSYGSPDTGAPFSLPTSGGEYVKRIPGQTLDRKESYEVVP